MFRVLTVGWMLLIFFLSSQPSVPIPQLFSGTDLVAHALFYAVLGLFLARSLAPPEVLTWRRAMLVAMLVTAYGLTDEYHQRFVPGRDASGWDILADAAGGLLAAVMLLWRDRRARQHADQDESGRMPHDGISSFPAGGEER